MIIKSIFKHRFKQKMKQSIIFGTHKLSKDSILYALKNGICFLDTATGYNNGELIGKVLKDFGDHFDKNINIVTKFNPNDFSSNFQDKKKT